MANFILRDVVIASRTGSTTVRRSRLESRAWLISNSKESSPGRLSTSTSCVSCPAMFSPCQNSCAGLKRAGQRACYFFPCLTSISSGYIKASRPRSPVRMRTTSSTG